MFVTASTEYQCHKQFNAFKAASASVLIKHRSSRDDLVHPLERGRLDARPGIRLLGCYVPTAVSFLVQYSLAGNEQDLVRVNCRDVPSGYKQSHTSAALMPGSGCTVYRHKG